MNYTLFSSIPFVDIRHNASAWRFPQRGSTEEYLERTQGSYRSSPSEGLLYTGDPSTQR